MKRFSGKQVVVTGGAAGIGEALVRQFLDEGARVVAIDLKEGAIRHDQLSSTLFDVANPEAWKTFAEELPADQPVDVLVNNAGISGLIPFDELSVDTWRKFQTINTEAAFLATQALYPALKRSPAASIVNIGSLLGLRPGGSLPAYSASKGALINLTKSLALEFAQRGEPIRCNLVHPGSTMTDMMRANLGNDDKTRNENLARRMAAHPYSKALGRLVEPDDIANAVLFLASEEAAFITGVDLPVDGGASI